MSAVDVRPWLDKLEDWVDVNHVSQTSELQRKAFAFEPIDHVPTAIRYDVPSEEWPWFSFQEIYNEPSKMLMNELHAVYIGAKLQDDSLYGVRANYGTGIIASMFGCEQRAFENTLPIGLHLSSDALERVLSEDEPDVYSGIIGKALDTVAYYKESLKPYPKLSQTIKLEMLDIQGPFDNASIIWGSDIFLAVYEEPEKVKRLCEHVTSVIMKVLKEHRKIDGTPVDEHAGCWNHLGGVCIRNDSSVSLSGNSYEAFGKPYDKLILGEFGGWVHFCGRAHQWWELLLDMPGIKGTNPYQGEFYNLVDMYEKCEKNKVAIVQWTSSLSAMEQERIRTGFSRIIGCSDFDEALRLKERLHQTGHAG